MMKSLFTQCPYCGASFYESVPEEEEMHYLKVECPYCNNQYRDNVNYNRIKKHDFYWEIYSGLYPPMQKNKNKKSRLLIGGLLLALTIPFFIFGLMQILIPSNLSGISGTEINSLYGIGLAGFVFLIFVISGTISAIKCYSFVISLSGIIFALLSSVLWYTVFLELNSNLFTNFSEILLLGPQIMAIISLALIVRNKSSFKLGY